MTRFVLLCFLMGPLLETGAPAQVKDLKLEYRLNHSGGYTAFLKNSHGAALTAYIAQASFQDSFRERHTSIGGDSLGFTNGTFQEIAPNAEMDTGNSLPHGASPSANRILAAIYADGYTEGEDEVVQMLLAGRKRAYADLKQAIPKLERAAAGEMKTESLNEMFVAMQSRDQQEAAELDDIEDAPGRMRHRYFMSAVPVQALSMLSGGADVKTTLAQLRQWEKRLAESKPDIR